MVCLARNAIYLKKKVGLWIRIKIKPLYKDDYRQRYHLPDAQLLRMLGAMRWDIVHFKLMDD